jgi:hypothetical protein
MARPDMTQAQAEAAIRGVSDGFDRDFLEFEEMEDALAKGDAKRFIEMHKRRYVDPAWCEQSDFQ